MIGHFTVLTGCTPRGGSLPGRYYAKAWHGHTQAPILPPYIHSHRRVPIDGIETLSELLTGLEGNPSSCVIRGRAKAGAEALCRRTGKNFEDAPHHWVCFDFDSIPGDLEPCLVVQQSLPSEFHDASFHWQYSGSHGFKPGTRLHVWFWMDRAVDCEGWNLWLWSHGVDWAKKGNDRFLIPIDPVLYRTVQPHITANPIITGAPDPVAVRSGFQQGAANEVRFVMGQHEPGQAIRKAVESRANRDDVPPISLEEWRARQAGVIGQFNLRYSVDQVLVDNGYQRVDARYLHPQSTSGVPDTVINSGTHAYAFSPNNPLYERGIDRSTGEVLNRNMDAFDCYRVLEHDGDERKAVKQAALLLSDVVLKKSLEAVNG